MKHRAVILSLAAALAAGTLVGADAPKFDALTDWNKNPKLTLSPDGVFTVEGKRVEVISKPFAVDPAKTYRFSMEVRRAPGSGDGACYIGNWSLSAKNVRMMPQHVMAAVGTDSMLTADAKKGAKEVVIKRPAKWRDDFKRLYWSLVFDAKADLSDLPNLSGISIAAAEADGENLKLTLQGPLTADYPAGTAVRCHSSGGGMYGGMSAKIPAEEWTPVAWTVSGIAPSWNPVNKWWRGTVKGAIRIIVGYNKPSKLEFRNVKLEIAD